MAKKTNPDFVNKRHVALSKKEAEQRRKVFMILGAIGIVSLLILAAGVIYTYVITPAQAVAVVQGTEISREDYQKRVLYERYLLDEQAALINLQYQQLAQSLQDSPELMQSLADQVQQQLSQIAGQRVGADRQALDLLIEEELVKQEAAKRGITVSEEELNETYLEIAAARSGGYTEAAAQETVTAGQNATATAAMFTPTPTPIITDTQTLTGTPPTPAPQPTPTINIIAGADLDQAVSDWEGVIVDNTKLSPAELRELVRNQLLKQKLIEAMGEGVKTTELQTHARHILVETRDEALAARVRLDTGETFEEVAADVSIDPGTASQGGDLGWFGQGVMVEPFNEVAFSLPVGEISEPVETQFGFHIIEILGREERDLSASNLARAKNQIYGEWLQEARSVVQDLWEVTDAPPDTSNPFGAPGQQ